MPPLLHNPWSNVPGSFLVEKQQRRESSTAKGKQPETQGLQDSVIFQGSIPLKIVLTISLRLETHRTTNSSYSFFVLFYFVSAELNIPW